MVRDVAVQRLADGLAFDAASPEEIEQWRAWRKAKNAKHP
jgi:endonuclease YncB( thermonuclease family)